MEPLFLGLSVGLTCLASCGAVLLPWLVAEQRPLSATAWLLAQVLAGRLAGYLLFAVAAWGLGLLLVPADLRSRALLFGFVHLALAAVLLLYVFGALRRLRGGSRHVSWHPRIGVRLARLGPIALGVLTGINVCPPFVAATVRAAELHSLVGSLAFFAVFFVGTSVWFLPFLAAGAARRRPEARTVAQVAMIVVAAYYAYIGGITVGWRLLNG